ncbi:hypothetical protein KIW84_041282 [Lathyrus oleraceus]|uniref:Uncharacterized protein n=1 Tax=Pisum sativum TaxID=3888 RepID=A0A9D4X7T5_PEA|nr:hypothetical protein KIW84_041282 [Pisum sativum]
MTKIFLKTLSSFYYERIIASSPNHFTEMVNMGMRLEEGVCEGSLSKDEASTSKKYGRSFSKKKEGEINALSVGRQRRPRVRKNSQSRQHQHQVSSVIPGAPGHDIENRYPLKYEVQKLVKSAMVSFKDRVPNVKANQLPAHGNTSVNMVDGCPGNFRVFGLHRIRRFLVEMHRTLCLISDSEHDHDGCVICSVNPRGRVIIKRDIQKLMDENIIQVQQSRDMGDDVNVIVSIFKTPKRVVIQFDSSSNNVNRSVLSLVIRLVGPIPYASNKGMPCQYNSTMIEKGQEVPLHIVDSVVNIADEVKVTCSGRVFSPAFPKIVEDVSVGKKA